MNKPLDQFRPLCYVHFMNDKDGNTTDYRSLLLLDEISRNNEVTQRDLSKRLGVALGLINSYLKNLASKGYITISTIPRNRYKYYLTATGITEKTRLTYRHLQNFTSLYRVARKDFQTLFEALSGVGVKKIIFCGVDEVADIAYLSLKEAGLELSAVADIDPQGRMFFGQEILALHSIGSIDFDIAVITSFAGGDSLKTALCNAGVDEKKVCDISSGGWLKKIKP